MTVANRREVSGTTTGTDRCYRQTHTIEHFVSLRKSCRHHGLRFGCFSLANEILTPWQHSDQDKTEQYELSQFILLHVHNCAMLK